MEENRKDTKSSAVGGAGSEMVTTLDGRVVSKKEIKDGEIYINAEGKKVRKVVKKAVKAPKENVVASESPSQSIEEKGEGENVSPVVSEQENLSAVPEVKEEKDVQGESFLDRVNSKHSFLERIRNNEKISTPKFSEPVAPVQTESSDSSVYEESDEDVAPDRSVSDLESAVVDEAYSNSIGKGSSYASANIGTESKVSGLATNPNASPTAILNQAGNPISQSLAGNQVLPTPINAKAPTKKAKKKRKPIKLWIPMTVLASVYVVCCLVYFFTCYNFADKSVDIGKYYIAIGEESKKEYYDGQKFNFYELIMTYYWSGENVEEYDLTKLNMVEPTNSMGYTLNNGYINGIWDGEYASDEVQYRDVNVKFLYKEETCYVPVRIYKNILTSLNCYSSIKDLEKCKEGDGVSATVFGVYTNKVMVDEGINSIERKLDPGEYDLWIHLHRGSNSVRQKLEFDATTRTYKLPRMISGTTVYYKPTPPYKADDLKITANAVDDYNISCYTYDKYAVETYDKIENPSMVDGDKPFTIQTINSQLTGTTTELKSARFNEPFTFSIKENQEQGYTLRPGFKVLYNIMNSDGEYVHQDFKELTADELDNYRIEREEISGKIVIKVVGCSNTYNAVFYTKENSSSEYRVYDTVAVVKGNVITPPEDPTSTSYFEFKGWVERLGDGSVVPVADWTTMVMGTSDRVFEAQYTNSSSVVAYLSSGYEITDLEGNVISSITYGETLNFKLRLKQNYSFGGENVMLYYRTGEGALRQIFPNNPGTGQPFTTSQPFNPNHTYTINGEALTGDLQFDLNMLYTVTESNSSFTADLSELRRTISGAQGLTHIKITLSAGFSAGDETPVLTYNGIQAEYCESHSDEGTGKYCYLIDRTKVTNNLTITLDGLVATYNVVAQAGTGENVNFKIMTADGSEEITSVTLDTEDFTFKVVPNIGYEMTSATVSVLINGTPVACQQQSGVYTLSNSTFNGQTADIVIVVTGVTEIPQTPPQD